MASAPVPPASRIFVNGAADGVQNPPHLIGSSTHSIACATLGVAGSSRRSARVRTRGCDFPLATRFPAHGADHPSRTLGSIMKTNAIIISVALSGIAISIPAAAASGRPSEAQASSETACIVPDEPIELGRDAQPGSYARYLMLNGKPRERAIVEARNIDHPEMRQMASQRVAPTPTQPAKATANRAVLQ